MEQVMMAHGSDLNIWFTNATLVFAAFKIGPIIFFLFQRRRLGRLREDRLAATLYLTSKLAGVLTVAFALAAASSAGRGFEAAGLSALLVLAGGLTFWSVFGRLAGTYRSILDLKET